jgi:hypothetical protein
MKKASPKMKDELRKEYKRSDFGKMVRGKYAEKIATASNVVVLDPEVSKAFPNDQAVNAALHSLIDIAKATVHPTKESSVRQQALKQYDVERAKLRSVAAYAPYNWDALNSTLPIEWIAYSQFLQEHASELANSINEFRQHIDSLSAWEKVLAGLDQQEKHSIVIVIEFVSPLATLALNMPYVIRSRFIYSVAHLSHQANQLKQDPWVDDLPVDSEIYFQAADKYGRPWKKYGKLKVALEKLASIAYEEATHDFRNKYNHRYSPRIEIGLTGLVTRTVNADGRVSYGFGQTNPLMLKDIIPLLRTQHTLSLAAYERYQALVSEQITAINTCVANA